MPRHLQRLDCLPRDACGDLLAAFVMSGWESLLPLGMAMDAAERLSAADPIKARKLSGYIIRGEQMPPEIEGWVRSMRATK